MNKGLKMDIEISKYKDYKQTTEYQPDMTYTQVTSNPTAIASILLTIDSLDENECIVIRKLPKDYFKEINK